MAAAGDHWGDALVAGDFNCDGYDDLAIGAPRKQGLFALVSILYGTSGGITSVGDQLLSRDGSFGAALAVGNFNGDEESDIGCDDLVVGAPLSSSAGASNGGVLYVHPGGASGIDTQPSETIHQGVTDVVDDPEADDFFAWRLARARLDDDAYDDLLVAVPGDACAGSVGIGLHQFYGSSTGITVTDNAIACDTFGCSVFEDKILACHAGSTSVLGTAIDDVISTGASAGVIWGGSGHDALYGDYGDDVFFGGDGDDFLVGGPGRDTIIAGAGDDIIVIDVDCVVKPGEVVDGGPGTDTILSHLSEYQLEGLGLTIVSVENFVTIDENPRGASLCVIPPLDDGPYLRPRVSASWSGLGTPDAGITTSTGILTLQLKNTSADDVDVDLEFVLRVRGEELRLELGPETVAAATTEAVTLDLNDFIPSGINPTTVDPALLVLPVSASITTRAKLSINSVHVGYSFAPTIFGHLEIGSSATAVLYREGALHDTYHHGDLGRWRANAAPYAGPAKILRRIEAHGSYGIPGY